MKWTLIFADLDIRFRKWIPAPGDAKVWICQKYAQYFCIVVYEVKNLASLGAGVSIWRAIRFNHKSCLNCLESSTIWDCEAKMLSLLRLANPKRAMPTCENPSFQLAFERQTFVCFVRVLPSTKPSMFRERRRSWKGSDKINLGATWTSSTTAIGTIEIPCWNPSTRSPSRRNCGIYLQIWCDV